MTPQLPTIPTLEQAQAAGDAWGYNCGPAAFCAVTGLSPDAARPLFGADWPGYTNPTRMAAALRAFGLHVHEVYRGDAPVERIEIKPPAMALTRIQWSGRWCDPGVPMGARYRKSHWIAETGDLVYDVNASKYGWISREWWETDLVPWLLNACVPRADGKFWPTHVWRIGG